MQQLLIILYCSLAPTAKYFYKPQMILPYPLIDAVGAQLARDSFHGWL
ncbi:hypothetical protein BVRB_5g107460 [Beta vulgaris subsp. vulgaris]|nr:hypothetical protein BVRB_5g107460 [Beta vulgaris subsp. vulgaris]